MTDGVGLADGVAVVEAVVVVASVVELDAGAVADFVPPQPVTASATTAEQTITARVLRSMG